MAKETAKFRGGPWDDQSLEVNTDQNEKNHDEVKKDRIIVHHYRRVKKENPKPGELPEFELDFIEHIDPKTGQRLDT